MKKIRCAIYTRKSAEEGLEQEFNSLDAQHADDRPCALAFNVSPKNVYQVGMYVNSLDDLPEALDLANAAFEDAG